jgi:hypothetical protein
MTSYATEAMVQGLVPLIVIGPLTVPSQTQVQQYIDSRSAEIDATLASLGFQTPITAPPEVVADLAQLNAEAAAGDVWLSTFISAPGVNGQANGQALLKSYEDRLTGMRTGVGIPVGLGYAETNRTPRSFFTDTQSIGQDMDAFDAWGDEVRSDPVVTMGKLY